MTLFVLLVSVPAFLFCCSVLVHFQKEILKGEGTGLTARERVSLDRQDDRLSESAVLQIDSRTNGPEKRTRREVYQIESAYLGPFFVVRAENGRDWQVTNACDEHHRVPSVARG